MRRARLDVLLSAIPALAFRMIAAQALVHRAELVTLNPDDFRMCPV